MPKSNKKIEFQHIRHFILCLGWFVSWGLYVHNGGWQPPLYYLILEFVKDIIQYSIFLKTGQRKYNNFFVYLEIVFILGLATVCISEYFGLISIYLFSIFILIAYFNTIILIFKKGKIIIVQEKIWRNMSVLLGIVFFVLLAFSGNGMKMPLMVTLLIFLMFVVPYKEIRYIDFLKNYYDTDSNKLSESHQDKIFLKISVIIDISWILLPAYGLLMSHLAS